MDNDEIDKNLNTLFKLVHVTSFNVSMQALMLLNQVIDSRDDMIHRYYNALYKKMFDLEWRNTSKQTFFLNLLFNSIKKDEALPRIRSLCRRRVWALWWERSWMSPTVEHLQGNCHFLQTDNACSQFANGADWTEPL